MTRSRQTHLNDEELARLADALLSVGEMREVDTHLSSCEECHQALVEMLRGSAVLALASDPPVDMALHVRARRWAAGHDRSTLAALEAGEDVAEVAGRGMDTDLPDSAEPAEPAPDGEGAEENE